MVNCKWFCDDSRCSLVYQSQFKQTNNNPVLQYKLLFFIFLSSWQADRDSSCPCLYSSPLVVWVSRSCCHRRHGVRHLTTTPYLSWSIVSITHLEKLILEVENSVNKFELYQQALLKPVFLLLHWKTLMKTELNIFPQLHFAAEHIALRDLSKSLSFNKIY